MSGQNVANVDDVQFLQAYFNNHTKWKTYVKHVANKGGKLAHLFNTTNFYI